MSLGCDGCSLRGGLVGYVPGEVEVITWSFESAFSFGGVVVVVMVVGVAGAVDEGVGKSGYVASSGMSTKNNRTQTQKQHQTAAITQAGLV